MPPQFYEIDVQTRHSSGNHTVEAMVQRAEQLGFAGITVTDYVQDTADLADIRDTVTAIDPRVNLRIGAKLRADNGDELKKQLQQVRDHVDVVVVHGGDVDVNRVACGDTRVDVLAHPELQRKDPGLDHAAIKQAAENRVAIQLNIRQLLETRGKIRSHILSHMRQNVRLAQEFDTPIITSSGAQQVSQLRAPRDLAAFPRMLGMNLEDSMATVSSVPQTILERADRARDDDTVQPGVRNIANGDENEQ
jgi:ribonuclease P/MRP protein subunit RPP1